MGKQIDIVLPAVKLTFPDMPLGSRNYFSIFVFLIFASPCFSVYKLFFYFLSLNDLKIKPREL